MAPIDGEAQVAIGIARTLGGDCDGPVDVISLAKSLGVRRIEPRTMVPEGYLGRTASGELVIRYRDDRPRTRTRFTIAHELGHILLAQAQGKEITGEEFRAEGESDEEEAAVNRIAAEILMPLEPFRRRVRSLSCCWPNVVRLGFEFDVSVATTVRRITECPGIGAFWLRVVVRDGKAPVAAWRIAASQAPPIEIHGGVAALAKQLCLSAGENRPLSVIAKTCGRLETLPVASRLVRSSPAPTWWFVSWTSADNET